MGANASLARRFFLEVWNDRRDATIDELMAVDSVGWMEGSGEVRSTNDYKQARRELLEGLPDIVMTVEDVIEEGPKVAVRWSVTATHRGPLAGIPATNRKITARGITWLQFENGRIVRGWDSWNQGALLQSLKE